LTDSIFEADDCRLAAVVLCLGQCFIVFASGLHQKFPIDFLDFCHFGHTITSGVVLEYANYCHF